MFSTEKQYGNKNVENNELKYLVPKKVPAIIMDILNI